MLFGSRLRLVLGLGEEVLVGFFIATLLLRCQSWFSCYAALRGVAVEPRRSIAHSRCSASGDAADDPAAGIDDLVANPAQGAINRRDMPCDHRPPRVEWNAE